MRAIPHCLAGLTALGLAAAVAAAPRDGVSWPQWRGPSGTGMAQGTAPASWGPEENVKWRAPVPGRACSTPVIWEDRIFLTTAVPTAGGDAGSGEHSFDVLCLDRRTGEVRWQRTAVVATPHEGYHKTYGSFASNSPVTDGEHLYAFFGSRGIYCYDLDGELAWKKDFDVRMEMRRQFGEGTAPVLHGRALILNFDHEGDSFIVVLDKRTGNELWEADRDEPSSWAPPLVVEHEGREQVVVSGTNKVRSYDLESGEPIWECAGLGTNAIPTPVQVGDTVLVMSGHRNPRLMAIRLGRTGDLTGTDAIAWSSTTGAAYTCSPVLRGDEFYALSDRGFLSCFDARTGEPFYLEQRLPRGLAFKASPVGVGDALYLLAETGEVVIVRMGPELEVLATIDSLGDELFLASPVVAGGELYLRSLDELVCIGQG